PPGEPAVCAQRQLQVLRQFEPGVEEADARSRAPAGRAGLRLVDRIKRLGEQRHVGPITVHDPLLAAVPVAVPQPAVRWRAAEQSDSTAEIRYTVAGEIVIEAEARRPQRVAAGQPSRVHV